MLKQIFVPITKVDAVKRLVYGVAALQQVDKTGETFHYDTSKPFFQSWSDEINKATSGKSYGNIRAMHGKVAAGKLNEPIGFNDDELMLEVCAKVVDDDEWTKVDEGVYSGFSIGGDYVKRWNEGDIKYYTAKPSEISLVDNPAMPGAHFTMVKSDGAVEDRPFYKYAAPEEPNMSITNEMVTARAEALAKAAGATGFADFIAQARTELEAEKAANPGGDAVVEVPMGGGSSAPRVKPSGKADIKDAPGSVAETEGKTPEGGAADDSNFEDESVKKPPAPGNEGDANLRPGQGATHPSLGKDVTVDPRNEVQQGWQSKDGSFHLTKAAAIAHNVKLDSPVGKLDEALGDLTDAVEKAKKKPPSMNDNADINDDQQRKAGKKPTHVGKDTASTEDAKTAEKNPPDVQKGGDVPGDGSKPYGDVKYADPGYKADKKKRYPVDTDKHIRAAWSYIHKPKNHTGYTSAQVSSIKSKIVSAWKEVIGGEPPAANEKSFRAHMLQKSMHQVSRLACLIEELNWLHQMCASEAEWEKDNSPIPGQLKGDIASLVGTLKNLLDEEAAEMFSDEEQELFEDVLEMAASSVPQTQLQKFVEHLEGTELTKAVGISKAHDMLKAKMPKEHLDKLQEMHDHCCAMGAKCYDGGIGKAAGLDNKIVEKGMETLSAENAELREGLTKAIGVITEMAKDIRDIKEQPIVTPPTKIQVVDKSQDGHQSSLAETRELLKGFTPDALATAALRLTHAAGGQQVFKR